MKTSTKTRPSTAGRTAPRPALRALGLDRKAAAQLEASLRSRLAELQGALRTGVVARREGTAQATEEGTLAAEALESEIQVALLTQRSQQAAQIQGALQRLAQGEYGMCRGCREFIGVARLQALPFVQRCAACQVDLERDPSTAA